MATTTNYSWATPDDTDLVKDGAAAIRTLGSSIDTTVFSNAGAAIAKSLVDAKGDIIAATADNTVDRLAVGANNTVLTADSSTATGLKWAAPSLGTVLQMVSVTKTDTFTTSSTSMVDITGVSVSITPTSASNNIFVMVTLSIGNDPAVSTPQVQIVRDSTAIGIGAAAGSRTSATGGTNSGGTNNVQSLSVNFLDSPATTSATTYKMQIRTTAAGTVTVNRASSDTDTASRPRTISTITVMEIAP